MKLIASVLTCILLLVEYNGTAIHRSSAYNELTVHTIINLSRLSYSGPDYDKSVQTITQWYGLS